jgi:hypothetical protein
MDFLDRLAERRIAEAIERGELDNLPGRGRPLAEDDAMQVAPELRAAYRVLKNAGYVPPEVEWLREIGALERSIACTAEGSERSRAARRMELLWQRLDARLPGARTRLQRYRAQMIARVAEKDRP